MLNKPVLLLIFLFLGACASTIDEVDAKNAEDHYQPIHKINSTKVFAADDKNANYADADVKKDSLLSPNIKIESEINENDNNKNSSVMIENKLSDVNVVKNKMAAMVLFENGSSEVDKKYSDELRDVIKTAKEKNAKVLVYGYASSKTINDNFESQKIINFKMSLKRAQSVAEYLRKNGVKKENIVVEAFGDAMPLLSDKMLEGERLNRRAEVYLLY